MIQNMESLMKSSPKKKQATGIDYRERSLPGNAIQWLWFLLSQRRFLMFLDQVLWWMNPTKIWPGCMTHQELSTKTRLVKKCLFFLKRTYAYQTLSTEESFEEAKVWFLFYFVNSDIHRVMWIYFELDRSTRNTEWQEVEITALLFIYFL